MTTLKSFGPGARDLSITLADLNPDVANALSHAFAGVDAVEVATGSLLDASVDAIVSAANSFGDMGGGVDKAIDDLYGGEAQRRVRAAIAQEYCGELPVGTALVVELPPGRFPFLVVAPTMRVPGHVTGTIHAYLAMRAALVAVIRHNRIAGKKIASIATSGLGTGVGGIAHDDAARQMRAAFESVVEAKWRDVAHPSQAPFAMR